MENPKALRDCDNNPVFVNEYGEYCDEFPEKSIVNRNTNNGYEYTVYFFVYNGIEHKELSFNTDSKQEALDFATDIYGDIVELNDSVNGEVFEVEVHDN